MPRDSALYRSAGLCTECRADAGGASRCPACKEKDRLSRNAGKYACSYCGETGHTKKVCKAHAADMARAADIDAWIASNPTLPDQLALWERQAALREEVVALRKEVARLKRGTK